MHVRQRQGRFGLHSRRRRNGRDEPLVRLRRHPIHVSLELDVLTTGVRSKSRAGPNAIEIRRLEWGLADNLLTSLSFWTVCGGFFFPTLATGIVSFRRRLAGTIPLI